MYIVCVRGTAWRHCSISFNDSSAVWFPTHTEQCVNQNLLQQVTKVRYRPSAHTLIRYATIRRLLQVFNKVKPLQTYNYNYIRPSLGHSAAYNETVKYRFGKKVKIILFCGAFDCHRMAEIYSFRLQPISPVFLFMGPPCGTICHLL